MGMNFYSVKCVLCRMTDLDESKNDRCFGYPSQLAMKSINCIFERGIMCLE